MANKEHDTILSAQAHNIGNEKGILLRLNERKHFIDLGAHSGWIWLDLRSAYELDLAPKNYKDMKSAELDDWAKKNLPGNKITLVTKIAGKIPKELEAAYKECLVYAEQCGVRTEIEDAVSKMSKIRSDEELMDLITRDINSIFVNLSDKLFNSAETGRQKGYLFEELVMNYVRNFFPRYVKWLGFHILVDVPVPLKNYYQPEEHQFVGSRRRYEELGEQMIVGIAEVGVYKPLEHGAKDFIRKPGVIVNN